VETSAPWLNTTINGFNSYYKSLPTIPIIPTPTLIHSQHCLAIINNGTGGSFALVICSWSSKLTMLMKLAIEKTEMERDVSLRMDRRG
jgi:hypothetical protein